MLRRCRSVLMNQSMNQENFLLVPNCSRQNYRSYAIQCIHYDIHLSKPNSLSIHFSDEIFLLSLFLYAAISSLG